MTHIEAQAVLQAEQLYAQLKSVHAREGNDAAEALLKKILELNSQHSQANNDLAVLLFNRGDFNRALNFLMTAIQDIHNTVAFRNLGSIFQTLGKTNEALEIFRQLLSQFPDDAEIQNRVQELEELCAPVTDFILTSRNQLGDLFTQMGFCGNGIEIGVQEGNFSATILDHWNQGTLHLIDRWCHIEGYDDVANLPELSQKLLYLRVAALFAANDRIVIHKMDSLKAADMFRDGYFDWIYIDADHSFEGCQRDLNAWYPKLRSGGIFAGHDYVDESSYIGNFGVKSAVDEFVAAHNLKVYITKEPTWKSWYLKKT
jgi:tetratricopeptide (TPR) repeat protein